MQKLHLSSLVTKSTATILVSENAINREENSPRKYSSNGDVSNSGSSSSSVFSSPEDVFDDPNKVSVWKFCEALISTHSPGSKVHLTVASFIL